MKSQNVYVVVTVHYTNMLCNLGTVKSDWYVRLTYVALNALPFSAIHGNDIFVLIVSPFQGMRDVHGKGPNGCSSLKGLVA